MNIEPFLTSVTRWASRQPDVCALALVGSHAHRTARPDSDIDLVLLTTRPESYLVDVGWVDAFGCADRRTREEHGKLVSIRVWYADGCEVEFGIAHPEWVALPLDAGTRAVLSGGLRVLFERDALLSLAKDSLL